MDVLEQKTFDWEENAVIHRTYARRDLMEQEHEYLTWEGDPYASKDLVMVLANPTLADRTPPTNRVLLRIDVK